LKTGATASGKGPATTLSHVKITFRINADAEDQGHEEACIQNRGGREEMQKETMKAVQNFRE